MEPSEVARRIVKALIDGGFIHGWFGDKSEEFVQQQVDYFTNVFTGKRRIHINYVSSYAGNLSLYTFTPKEDIAAFIDLCGFKATWNGKYVKVFSVQV